MESDRISDAERPSRRPAESGVPDMASTPVPTPENSRASGRVLDAVLTDMANTEVVSPWSVSWQSFSQRCYRVGRSRCGSVRDAAGSVSRFYRTWNGGGGGDDVSTTGSNDQKKEA
ncbi:unnamed protein product [Chondrus crispus]|uniref:Uncharacterized protein n=1 Tax=Chondrus crispus TaxID=2769 RepID=R7Q4V0_CHOCR|nr:unnamed protein product [Chondrus crispus]CDF33562.1 unnamed protein product [Chondrus crispus]|eukprot:XP_005713364.1 unnamed protein product [Chondrus crispus]